MPLKSSIRTKKQTRFADQPVTSVQAVPPRRRPHTPKWNRDVPDEDFLIPIELSQPRAEETQDLGGNLSAEAEESLPNTPLGQFQAQEGNRSSEHSIASSDTETPSQSEIFSQSENIATSNKTLNTNTPSQREIFSETGTGSSSEEGASNTDSDNPDGPPTPTRSHSDQQESHSEASTSKPQHPPKVKYFLRTENIASSNSDYTSTSSQSEIYSSNSEYEAGSESSSRETSRPSSPEAGSHQNRTLCSPTQEMVTVTRSFHDAIHAVRDQHQRAVTRRLLREQVQQASQKAMVNAQIKTSTPDPPKANAMYPPRKIKS